ncbi:MULTISPECIES: hypothetical protein [unclassified Sphingomonas]|uniref:hypothetical protein n=1 Tax=unclassified Sphingomonas TaxID=196159 RepID=UPI00028A3C34|nr:MULTISPECIES: hypothetical protein [unclassified Sphingomonas]
MQRTLPLRAQTARHPFRQTVAAARSARVRARDDSDVRLFVLSFSAFFVCFYTFIF